MDRVPPFIQAIAFVVSAYQGGSFLNVETAIAHVQEVSPEGVNPLFDVSVGCHGDFTSLMMCVMHRNLETNQWCVTEVSMTAGGRHFQDCIDPIRSVVDQFLDEVMVAERVLSLDKTFNMKKDESARIPLDMVNMFMGLGWETATDDLDLDASCVMLDANNELVHVVYFGDKVQPGVTHMGDNLTGVGKGDDEVIQVRLHEVEGRVNSLVFVVNIYSDGRSFGEVFDSYCRLCLNSPSGGSSELAKYPLAEHIESRGLVFASLHRTRPGEEEWVMKALGAPCNGKRATECVDAVKLSVQGLPIPGVINIPSRAGGGKKKDCVIC